MNSKRRLWIVFIVSFILVLSSFAGITSNAEQADYCERCKNKGKIKSRLPKEYIKFPYKSSVIIEHKSGCCGLGWLPCPNKKCPKRAEALIEFNRLTGALKAWLNERRAKVEKKAFKDDKKLKDIKAMHADSDHFHISGTFKKRPAQVLIKGKWKKRTLSPAQSLHIYCTRCEYVFEKYMKIIGYKGDYVPKMTDRFTIAIWENLKQADAASFSFCGFTNSAGASIEAVVYTTADDADDLFLHHKIVVAAANMVTGDYHLIVEYFPVWLKEAIGHWIEYDIFKELRIFTVGEGDFSPNCPTKNLHKIIYDAVKKIFI